MSLDVVGHSKCKAKMVPVIVAVIGQVDANVVQIKRAHTEAFEG